MDGMRWVKAYKCAWHIVNCSAWWRYRWRIVLSRWITFIAYETQQLQHLQELDSSGTLATTGPAMIIRSVIRIRHWTAETITGVVSSGGDPVWVLVSWPSHFLSDWGSNWTRTAPLFYRHAAISPVMHSISAACSSFLPRTPGYLGQIRWWFVYMCFVNSCCCKANFTQNFDRHIAKSSPVCLL